MSVVSYIIMAFALFFAVCVHESAHAWAAYKLGDPTAYNLGRVTLNPIPHIDPMGTIIFPILLVVTQAPFLFGWAKPVPVNPLNLRNPRRDNLWISAAGPASNISIAVVALIGIVLLKALSPNVRYFLRAFIYGGGGLPKGFYPLEGLALILYFLAYINCFLAVFNLIPVPPLDGSGVLMGFLSDEAAEKYDRIRPYGFFIIIGLFFIGFLNLIIRPIYFLIAIIVVA
jgi:Zn-dependent protease